MGYYQIESEDQPMCFLHDMQGMLVTLLQHAMSHTTTPGVKSMPIKKQYKEELP